MKAKAIEALVALAVVGLVVWGCWRLMITSDVWQERNPTEGSAACQQ